MKTFKKGSLKGQLKIGYFENLKLNVRFGKINVSGRFVQKLTLISEDGSYLLCDQGWRVNAYKTAEKILLSDGWIIVEDDLNN